MKNYEIKRVDGVISLQNESYISFEDHTGQSFGVRLRDAEEALDIFEQLTLLDHFDDMEAIDLWDEIFQIKGR